MRTNIAVGIIKPNLGGNSLLGSPFQSFTKGSFNCVANVGLELETGDIVHNMWGDINTWWPDAIYNGGSILDMTNYTPLGAIDLDYNCTIPVDATVSAWSDWSTCNAGSQTRTRTVTTPASGGGTTPTLIETQVCTIPVDATVSAWSSWSSCVSGSQTRTRTVITPASGGGTTPTLIETQACTAILPLVDYYFEGFWETGDTDNHPEINSWVDYRDENGVQHRFMVGGNELGCQLLQASSFSDYNGCAPCAP